MSRSGEQNRLAILQAAERLLIERGFHGVGMEQIADAAGLSRQALYLRFKSKAGLLRALLDHIAETRGLAELRDDVLKAPTAIEALNRTVRLHVAYDPRIRDIAQTLYAARREEPVAEAAWVQRMAARRQGFRQVTERLAEEHVLDSNWTIEEATDLLWTVLSPHFYEYLVVEAGWPLLRYEEHVRTLLHRSLLGPKKATV